MTGSRLQAPGVRGSLRDMARALNVSRTALHDFLKHGKVPARTPDLAQRYLNYMQESQPRKEEQPMLTKVSLSDDVLGHWSLSADPFSAEIESVEDICELRDFTRAAKAIMRAVDKAGWVVVTGPVGCGKSTLLKRIEARLVDRSDVVLVKPRTIEKQYLGASHVCDSIIQDLSVSSSASAQRTLEMKARLVGRILEEEHRDAKRVVLLIDEAHLLRSEALLALKRIYEFEIGFRKLISIILVGQQGLARRLKTDFELTEVAQRVDLYEFGPLRQSNAVGAYLTHKLQRAGANGKEIFTSAAIKAIAGRAETPLAINNLAAAALYAAHALGAQTVTDEIVHEVQGGR